MTEGSTRNRHHDVVIVGGGNAGISLAARLRRDGCTDIAVIDPRTVHRYAPLLSYVGGGEAELAETKRPQYSVIPDGVRWYRHQVIDVDPSTRTVITEDGLVVTAGDLVLCPGVVADWDHVPGSREAVFSDRGASNYVDERAPYTWELIQRFRGGRAVFVVADGPVPCAGAALKPLFLAADHWRRHGVLPDVTITAIVPWPTIFGIPTVDAELTAAADRFGITVRTATRVQRIQVATRTLTLSGGAEAAADGGVGGGVAAGSLGYDLLHYVPRHRAPDWLADADLARSVEGATGDGTAVTDSVAGMIDVDPLTLAHRRHPAIWGLGDAADVAASRSGGALRKQVGVVADNIARRRKNRPYVHYDGYSTAPITVARDRLVLAEFDRTGTITPSVPLVDLTRTRWSTWAYDRYLQPQLYWHNILKGRVRR